MSTRHPQPSCAASPSPGDPDSTDIRDWARNQGIDAKDPGRIPAELIVKFKAATTR